MRIQELGHAIREARRAQGLTQAGLAASAGITRETINLIESGLIKELGIRKVLRVLERLGLDLAVRPDEPHGPDYVRMARTVASVSFKQELTEDELLRALTTGKVPPDRRPHLRTLLDEAPLSLLSGLANEASRWLSTDKLRKNLLRISEQVGASRGVDQWLTIG